MKAWKWKVSEMDDKLIEVMAKVVVYTCMVLAGAADLLFCGRLRGGLQLDGGCDVMSSAAQITASFHIDREKWEPCMWCVLNGQFGLNNYCSSCGRPLTDEAWAELERRFFGEV